MLLLQPVTARLARMPTSLVVVDEFLAHHDALGLRDAALGLTYPDLPGPFPGRNSLERLESTA